MIPKVFRRDKPTFRNTMARRELVECRLTHKLILRARGFQQKNGRKFIPLSRRSQLHSPSLSWGGIDQRRVLADDRLLVDVDGN